MRKAYINEEELIYTFADFLRNVLPESTSQNETKKTIQYCPLTEVINIGGRQSHQPSQRSATATQTENTEHTVDIPSRCSTGHITEVYGTPKCRGSSSVEIEVDDCDDTYEYIDDDVRDICRRQFGERASTYLYNRRFLDKQ
jgi:hypothetical protein